MTFRTVCVLILGFSAVQPIFAEKYETFDNLQATSDHGWSLFSATSDFAVNITPTSRARGQSGPGELEVDIAPVPFLKSAYFADTRLGGTFNLDTDFSFSGTLKLDGLDFADSQEIMIGFFDSHAARQSIDLRRAPFVGVVIGGRPGGGLFQSDGLVGIGNAWASGGSAGRYLGNFRAQDAVPITWNFKGDGEFGSEGTITAQIGSYAISYNLTSFSQDNDPTFDAFGVGILESRQYFGTVTDITLILDDLRYSTVVPEPASLLLLTILGSSIALLKGHVSRASHPRGTVPFGGGRGTAIFDLQW